MPQSRLFFGVIFPHIVLECQPITMFLIAELLLPSKSFVWVLIAELIAELLLLFQKVSFFHFLL